MTKNARLILKRCGWKIADSLLPAKCVICIARIPATGILLGVLFKSAGLKAHFMKRVVPLPLGNIMRCRRNSVDRSKTSLTDQIAANLTNTIHFT